MSQQWKVPDSHDWKGLVDAFKSKGVTSEEMQKFANFLWHHYTFHKLKPSQVRRIIDSLFSVNRNYAKGESMTNCECCGQPLAPYGIGMGGLTKEIPKEEEDRLHQTYQVVQVARDRKSVSAYNIVCIQCLESGCPKCDHRGHLRK